jgi:hypothetical protein
MTTSSSCILFKAKIRTDPAQKLRGVVRCQLTSDGLRLQQGAAFDVFLPIGTSADPRGSGRFSVHVADRDLELVIASWNLYPERLARDLCRFLNGQCSPLCRDDYVIPAYLFLPALLPLGIPVVTLGGILPGALGVGLAGGNLAIARLERWPLLARLASALMLTLLGYGVVVVLFVLLPLLSKGTTNLAAPAANLAKTTAQPALPPPIVHRAEQPVATGPPPLPGFLAELPLPAGSRQFSQLQFSADGQTLITMDWVGVCRLWDVRGREQRAEFQLERRDRFGWFAVSPDDKYLVAWDGFDQPCLRRLDTAEIVTRLDMNDPTFQASSDGRVYESDGDFSADGRLLAIVRNHRLRLWTIPEGRPVKYPEVILPPWAFLHSLRFGAEGKTLITAAWGWEPTTGARQRVVDVWDLENRKHVRRLEGFSHGHRPVPGVPLKRTADRKLLLIHDAGCIELLDWKSDRLVYKRRPSDHPFNIEGVALLPDGQTLVTGEQNGYVFFWDCPSKQQLRGYNIPSSDRAPSAKPLVAVSTEGVLATAENRLLLWNLREALPPR